MRKGVVVVVGVARTVSARFNQSVNRMDEKTEEGRSRGWIRTGAGTGHRQSTAFIRVMGDLKVAAVVGGGRKYEVKTANGRNRLETRC